MVWRAARLTARQGYTEITIVPTSRDLQTIHLHSRQCGESTTGLYARYDV